MTCLKLKNNYVTKCIRKHMRINAKKEYDFYYKLATIAKECAEYDNVYGCDMVWDFKKNCWITSKSNTFNMFNASCQIGANLINIHIGMLKKAIDIVIRLGEDEESQQFYMPSTSKVIAALKKEF